MDLHHYLSCSEVSRVHCVWKVVYLLMIVLEWVFYLCDMVVVEVLLYISTVHHHYSGAQLHDGPVCYTPCCSPLNHSRKERDPSRSRKPGDAVAVL